MRIAYLCKRQYMGHDVIVDRYARLYEHPRQLAARGHTVLGLCLSYRATDERDEIHDGTGGPLRWVGLAPGRLPLAGLFAYPRRALALLRAFRPDLLVGTSDCPHVVLAHRLARRLGVPFAADLYDHFESFGLSRLPGLIPAYRRALAEAAVVSCVSDPLAALVRERYRARGKVLSSPSTIDADVFFPRSREDSRRELGLPMGAKLVGSAGALSREKGIEAVYRAFRTLAAEPTPDVHLVLAGPRDPACPPPQDPHVHYLGTLPHAKTAVLFNALDAGIVYVRDTPYGRYSFPQKAYEMAACGLALAVADVGAMGALFRGSAHVLYTPDDPDSLARVLRQQLADPERPPLRVPDWAALASELETAYAGCVGRTPSAPEERT